jgi:hypothetical protein
MRADVDTVTPTRQRASMYRIRIVKCLLNSLANENFAYMKKRYGQIKETSKKCNTLCLPIQAATLAGAPPDLLI